MRDLNVKMPQETLDAIDLACGATGRNQWILDAIAEHLPVTPPPGHAFLGLGRLCGRCRQPREDHP